MDRREEHRVKVQRVREWLVKHDCTAALFATQDNFAWITAGGEAHVSVGGYAAVGSILVTSDRVYLLTNRIEEGRLQAEELAGLGMEAVIWPWYKATGLAEAAAQLSDPNRTATDLPGNSSFQYDETLQQLRYTLLPSEVERYRRLGLEAAEVVETACREITPGQSERELAAMVARGCFQRGIVPLVNLVAADERIRRYRHPVPTGNSIQKIVMAVLTGRRQGLHLSLTRLVAFGPVDEETLRAHQSVVAVDAAYILGSLPGRTLNDVLGDGLGRYKAEGYPDEWELHHQGGLTGYAGREIFATPSANHRLEIGQCLAWNPSITGSKSEDTVVIVEAGVEVLSKTESWPQAQVSVGDQAIERPEILQR